MGIRNMALAASAAAVVSSLLTLWATIWWPAWILLVPVWVGALIALTREWESDEPARDPMDELA